MKCKRRSVDCHIRFNKNDNKKIYFVEQSGKQTARSGIQIALTHIVRLFIVPISSDKWRENWILNRFPFMFQRIVLHITCCYCANRCNVTNVHEFFNGPESSTGLRRRHMPSGKCARCAAFWCVAGDRRICDCDAWSRPSCIKRTNARARYALCSEKLTFRTEPMEFNVKATQNPLNMCCWFDPYE